MGRTKQSSNGEPRTQGRDLRKAKVHAETSVPKKQKMNPVNDINYLTNDTKVKISASPKEMCKKHLEDTPITENFIPNTTRAEETLLCSELEKHLEKSDVTNLIAHCIKISRTSSGSEATTSLSDNSHHHKNCFGRDHLSNPNKEEPTKSKNAIGCNMCTDIVVPLKKKKKQHTTGRKSQIYEDVFDKSEEHTQSRKDGHMSNSIESSDTSFIKNKSPEHRLKKKFAVVKQDGFDLASPTILQQVKQFRKDSQRKTLNSELSLNVSKSCDQPKIFESRSSSDTILNEKPKNILRKKNLRTHGKNHFESLMITCSNIGTIQEVESKTGNISSSGESIPPATVNARYNFKRKHLKCGRFDSVVESRIVEDPVQNMHPDVNVPCTSVEQSKDISAEMDVLKAPASAKIVGKIKKKQIQHNFFESVVENDESAGHNVVEQHNDIALTEKCVKNSLLANTQESMDISANKLFVMKLFKKHCGSMPQQTLEVSGVQRQSQNSQNLEDRRRTNDRDRNCSSDNRKLVERKFLQSLIHTSENNNPILFESGRLTESPSDSLTGSKFKPKMTSSKICLPKNEISEQCSLALAALHLMVAPNRLNLTHENKQIDQSDNPIVCLPKSTDHESDKKKNKCLHSVCDNSEQSSDLTFDPDNVPHSTMRKSNSMKKHTPSAIQKIESKTRRSLVNTFLNLMQVSTESGENIGLRTENSGIRNNSSLKGRENEPAIENERNDNGTKYSELETNDNCSDIVEKYNNRFANKISVPENLYAVMPDHEPVAKSDDIPQNVLKVLTSFDRTSKLSASENDVSKVFRKVSYKTKGLAKSSSVNSQEVLISRDNKSEKKLQENNKSIPNHLENFPESNIFTEILKPQSKKCDAKSSVSMLRMEHVSPRSTSKTLVKSLSHAEIEQISHCDILAEKISNSEVEKLNQKKSDRVSFRAKRRMSSNDSYLAVLSNKLSQTDVLTSKKDRKMSDNSIENKSSDCAGAFNCSKEHSALKGTPELRELSSPFSSRSDINKKSHKENFPLSIVNNSKTRRKESNKNSTVSNLSNDKIVYSGSPGFSKSDNKIMADNYLKDSLDRKRKTRTERGSYTGAEGDTSLHPPGISDPSSPPLSTSQVNKTSPKANFSLNVENSSKVKSKESNKNSVVNNLSKAKIVYSNSPDTSNANNDGDYLKDNIHRNRKTGNERGSYTETQPQATINYDVNDTVEDRPVIIREPLEESKLTTHQKELNIKQTLAKPTPHARFLIDGEPYHKPKLARPKPWVNQRFYNHMLPKFDKTYGLSGSIKCEEFATKLCTEVTACIRKRKNWDEHVLNVQKLLSKQLSINTVPHYLIFAEKYLPDDFVFKLGLTYDKLRKKK